jgi:hypothetical protein
VAIGQRASPTTTSSPGSDDVTAGAEASCVVERIVTSTIVGAAGTTLVTH